jgi:hypothetical protein
MEPDTRRARECRWYDRVPPASYAVAATAVIAGAATILLTMGQTPICMCGYVKLWHGIVASSENSQHISDWYTFSHIIHGFGFSGALSLVARQWPQGLRLAAAVVLESAWEVFENTNSRAARHMGWSPGARAEPKTVTLRMSR